MGTPAVRWRTNHVWRRRSARGGLPWLFSVKDEVRLLVVRRLTPELVDAITQRTVHKEYRDSFPEGATFEEIRAHAEKMRIEAESKGTFARAVAAAVQADTRQGTTREYYARISSDPALTAITVCEREHFITSDPDRLLDGTFTVFGKVISDVEEDVPTFARNKLLRNLSADAFEEACLLQWDTRLFEVAPVVLGIAGDIVDLVAKSVGEGALRIEVPKGTTALLLDAKPLNLFPNEHLEAPRETSATLSTAGQPDIFVAIPSVSHEVQAWGAELEADWTTLDGVVLPRVIRLTSIGPHATPPGVIVEVVVPSIVNWSPSGVGFAITSQEAGDRSSIAATFTGSLLPGEVAELTFPPVAPESETTPQRNPKVVSGAWLRASPELGGMRDAPKSSVYPLTASGLPVSTFVAEPSA